MKRVLLAILLAGVAQLARADWPQWRGPNRDGVAADTALPVQWSATQNVRWKVPLPGAGNGSPIIYRDLVLVTATSGRDHGELHVLAYDRGNGQPVWRTNLFASPAPPPYALFPPERGHAAPTPAVDGRQVVALFGSGDLVALDLEGRPLWMRSLVLDYGPIEGNYGLASSPLIVDDLVVVQIDRLDGSYLAAFDVATGAT
ncbi:MAG: PQQ-binding-like beta-propeller repeat protein, partial [Thermoguttaceae bacterium]|nr:PQQ-binding-like beta-propeller repeat protein [Thermoguttaceae bacterium]